MMTKIIDNLKKYKITIIGCLGVLFIGFIIITVCSKMSNKIDYEEYTNSLVSLKYAESWKVKENKDNSINLKYNKDSEVNIKVVNLEKEYEYSKSEELIDEILIKINQQNKTYNLLSKEEDLITKYKYDGFKLLYENEDSQVMVFLGKVSNKLLIITYEASNEYFDILLDSVHNIVYNCRVLDQEFDLSYKIDIDTDKIKWPTEENKFSNKKKTYEIAKYNYIVNFSIPEFLTLNGYDSQLGYFTYRDYEKNEEILVTVTVKNTNIYNAINKNNRYNLFSVYHYDTEEYLNFKEALSKEPDDYEFDYIYKNSYEYNNIFSSSFCENVILIYEIDYNHIVTFDIKAKNVKITKSLVDSFDVKSTKNYSSYIKRKVEDEKLIGELYLNSFDLKKKVTLYLPEEYKELDKDQNFYISRYYGYDLNEKKNLYKYNVNYNLGYSSNGCLDDANYDIETYGEKNANKQIMTYVKDVEINGLIFKMYSGGYTEKVEKLIKDKSADEFYYINIILLTYEFDEYKGFSIEIRGNGEDITEEVIKKLTNFKMENY